MLDGTTEIADYGNGNSVRFLTVPGAGGLPTVQVTPGSPETLRYYHHDILGSTLADTAPGTAGVKDVFTYNEFGAPPVIGAAIPFRFAGMRIDYNTGYYYDHARYYSPTLRRFLEPDPIGASGGIRGHGDQGTPGGVNPEAQH